MTTEEVIRRLKKLESENKYRSDEFYCLDFRKSNEAEKDAKALKTAQEIILQSLQSAKEPEEQKAPMTNAEWCLNKGIKFADIKLQCRKQKYGGGCNVARRDTNEIIGYIVPPHFTEEDYKDKPFFNYTFELWLDQEHEDCKEPVPILTGEERGYLKQVIAPFKDKVEWIFKNADDCNNKEMFILIRLYNGDSATLPNFFIKDNLFNGMKLYKKYTLRELGL